MLHDQFLKQYTLAVLMQMKEQYTQLHTSLAPTPEIIILICHGVGYVFLLHAYIFVFTFGCYVEFESTGSR